MFALSFMSMAYVIYEKESIKYATIIIAAFLGTAGRDMPGRGDRNRNEDVELGQPPEVGDDAGHGDDHGLNDE